MKTLHALRGKIFDCFCTLWCLVKLKEFTYWRWRNERPSFWKKVSSSQIVTSALFDRILFHFKLFSLSKYFRFLWSLFTLCAPWVTRYHIMKCWSFVFGTITWYFISFQGIDGERRAIKRQKTAPASFLEANKIEEIHKPCTGNINLDS